MFNVINAQDIEIFANFFNEFRQLLEVQIQQKRGTPLTVQFGNTDNERLSTWVDIQGDPFSTNTSFNAPPILINEPVCDTLKLSERELYAFIAHEFGHILDDTPRGNDQLGREINADQTAVELGLTQELISGLQKLVDSGLFTAQNQSILSRIQNLNMPDN